MIFNQDKIVNFIVLELTITPIKFFIVQSIPGLSNYNYIFNIFISLILLPFLVFALISAFKENLIFSILIIMIFLLIILLQILIFPENKAQIFLYIKKIIGVSMSSLIVSYSLKDYKSCYYKLVKNSKIIILFGILEFVSHKFFGVVGSDTLVNYDMSFGYFLVIPTILSFNEIYLSKNKILNICFFLISMLMVIILGSRGAVLAIFVGCILIWYENLSFQRIKDIFYIIYIFILGVFLFVNFKKVSKYFYNFLIKLGIDSRFFSMLSQGHITSSTGRSELQEKVFKIILEHPWLGIGMLKDTSSHNIFYEVMLFYGIPIGIFVIILIIYYWLKILVVKESFKRKLMIVFLSYSVIDSLLNLTVLGKDIFWIYLGLAMSTKIYKKRKVKIKI